MKFPLYREYKKLASIKGGLSRKAETAVKMLPGMPDMYTFRSTCTALYFRECEICEYTSIRKNKEF